MAVVTGDSNAHSFPQAEDRCERSTAALRHYCRHCFCRSAGRNQTPPLGVVLLLTAINSVPEILRIAGLVCLIPIGIFVQGLVVISIVREDFKRRG